MSFFSIQVLIAVEEKEHGADLLGGPFLVKIDHRVHQWGVDPVKNIANPVGYTLSTRALSFARACANPPRISVSTGSRAAL